MKTETDGRAATRRRGRELDEALLDAAWEHLRSVGYTAFTIDAVARAAGTSRAVIYRRWPGRAALVLAAVRAHTGTVVDNVPDTGSLEGDVLALLRGFASRIEQMGIDVARGLLGMLDEIPDDDKTVAPNAFRQVIDRARTRGDLGDSPIPDGVLAMPGVLIRYSTIAERAPLSDEELERIAYQLFLPLVRYHAALPPSDPAGGATTALG